VWTLAIVDAAVNVGAPTRIGFLLSVLSGHFHPDCPALCGVFL
jgi:hypothetical protein